MKFYGIQGGCASSRLIHGFLFAIFGRWRGQIFTKDAKKLSTQGQFLVNPHERCGYSDSPFARIYFFHTAGSGNGLEEVDTVCPGKLTPRKRHFFLIQKYIEDARQEEKHVPDLLETIMRPTDPVKEELRQNLFKLAQFRSKIQKNNVSTVWIPEIRSFPAGGQCQPARQ